MKSQLDIVEVTGSTNDDLLKMGKEGAPHGYGLGARRPAVGAAGTSGTRPRETSCSPSCCGPTSSRQT